MAFVVHQVPRRSKVKARRVTRNGREYLVAPLTLLVPGVLRGSEGPLYYPVDQVSKEPDNWNHMPIVVYHPVDPVTNKPVSARSPEVLEKYGIGFVYRSHFNGKLRAEGWFDVEDTRRVDSRVLDSLEQGEPIELSTGLFLEKETAPEGATYNGRSYLASTRNYKPDHLAVLPDQVGACSIRDGCGVLVNQQSLIQPSVPPSSFKGSSWSVVEVGTDSTSVPGGRSEPVWFSLNAPVGTPFRAPQFPTRGVPAVAPRYGSGLPLRQPNVPIRPSQSLGGSVGGKGGAYGKTPGQRKFVEDMVLRGWHGRFSFKGSEGSGGLSAAKVRAKLKGKGASSGGKKPGASSSGKKSSASSGGKKALGGKISSRGRGKIGKPKQVGKKERRLSREEPGKVPKKRPDPIKGGGGKPTGPNRPRMRVDPGHRLASSGISNVGWTPLEVPARPGPAFVNNPKGEWTPPPAGKEAPKEIRAILQKVYAKYRDEHPAEDPKVKARGAKIAWAAVRKAGWSKDKEGRWKKSSRVQNVGCECETPLVFPVEGPPLEIVSSGDRNGGYPMPASAGKGSSSVHSNWRVLNQATDLSFDELQERVYSAFRQAHPVTYDQSSGMPKNPCWVVAVFDGYVIYSDRDGLWRQDYSVNGGKVKVEGTAEEVQRVTKYVPVGNRDPLTGRQAMKEVSVPKLRDEERREIIDFLATNSECWKGAGDRDILARFDDEKLLALRAQEEQQRQVLSVANTAAHGFRDGKGNAYRINPETGRWEHSFTQSDQEQPSGREPSRNAKGAGSMTEYVADDEEEEEEDLPEEPETAPRRGKVRNREETPSPRRPQTADEWFRSAPAEVQNTLRYAQDIERREKEGIIVQLLTNVAESERGAHRERLLRRPLPDLQNDLALLPKSPSPAERPAPSAGNRSRSSSSRPAPDDDMLTMPIINWKELEVPGGRQETRNQGSGQGSSSSGSEETMLREDTEAEWLRSAPPSIRTAVQNAMAIEQRERNLLIDDLVGNADEETEGRLRQRLQRLGLDELKDLASLSSSRRPAQPQPNYFGATGASAPLSNFRGADATEDVLPLPTIDWGEDPRRRKA